MYLNETFASLKMDNMMQWMEVPHAWHCVELSFAEAICSIKFYVEMTLTSLVAVNSQMSS